MSGRSLGEAELRQWNLDPSAWQVEIEKNKAALGRGRRVAVKVTHRPSGRSLEDSEAGAHVSKGQMNKLAERMVLALVEQLAPGERGKKRKRTGRRR